MRSRFLIALLASVAVSSCVSCAAVVSRSPSTRSVPEQYASALLVTTKCRDFFGRQVRDRRGSAVVVGERTALTALHVVECPPGTAVRSVSVESPGGVAVAARVGREDPASDLATLDVGDPAFEGRRVVVGARPEIGERVCTAPALPQRAAQCGSVIPGAAPSPGGDLKHTAISEPGNSGAGLYDSRGALVGVVTHQWRCSSNETQICGGAATALDGRWP